MQNNRNNIIKNFLDYLENMLQYSKNTIRSYSIDLDDYIKFCETENPNMKFEMLGQDSIQLYMRKLSRDKLQPSTIARKLAAIKSLYKFMIKEKITNVNITRLIKTPKTNKSLPNFLSLKEANDILTMPNGHDKKSYRDRLILELFYSTGIRISELVKIKIEDIHFNEGTINVLGKGKRERVVMIGEKCDKIIRQYLEKVYNIIPCEKFLFKSYRTKSNTGHISERTVFNIVKKYCKLVSDNEKLSPHSLRHTFATHMLNNGADLMAIKNLLGHSSLSSTQIYSHLEIDRMKEIYKQSHPHGK